MKFTFAQRSKATFCSLFMLTAFTCGATEQIVSLQQAIRLAQTNDPWLHGNQLQQQAKEHLSIAASALPDPALSLTMANIPTNGWALDQEAMTQIKLGVSQKFPRGDSLAIKASQVKIQASQFPLLRAERKAKLIVLVSELWLDAYLAQQNISLIESDWALFEQMAEIAKANYSNAVGKTRQQDVIRAQLEIVQLEDRLAEQKQQLDISLAKLNEWLHIYQQGDSLEVFDFDQQPLSFAVTDELPDIRLAQPSLLKSGQYSRNKLAHLLRQHPALLAVDVKQQVAEKSIELVKQEYKPQWGVNASYGYRDDTPSGESRADLFSIGVTFDLPLFTDNRQDKKVLASIAETEAIKTEKLLLTKQMLAAIEKELRVLKRLSQRQTIYQQQLLVQTHDQAEASLTAYTNDDGDFAEVVRARIAGLNARMAALKIDVDALKTVVRINYFFAKADSNQAQLSSQNSGVYQ